MNERLFLRDIFKAALAAADPAVRLGPLLPTPPKGRTIVIGAGKAAASMAAALERHWRGPLDRMGGLVVTRYGHGQSCERIEVVEAAHPVPDGAGRAAAARILHAVRGLTADDLVIALISGGGSALMALPAAGVSLADKQAVSRALLMSGAAIDEMNCVRKHLSAIKGGRLALAAWPARVEALAISDVPGDDPAVIASGPTVADPTTCADALAVLAKYAIDVPPSVLDWLCRPEAETPKPGDPHLANSRLTIISRPLDALEAAADFARSRGVLPLILGDALEGEAKEVARTLAGIAVSAREHGLPLKTPCVLLSGGETTVTFAKEKPAGGWGRGGRNAEFLLALGLALDGRLGISALACDTDGIDGSEDNAGAVLLPDTLERGRVARLSAPDFLARHDAYGYFHALDDLVVTGPTRTNVNDFRAILVS